MDFGSSKKESVAEKARRERIEREAQRRNESNKNAQSNAVTVIKRAWGRHRDRIEAGRGTRRDWDRRADKLADYLEANGGGGAEGGFVGEESAATEGKILVMWLTRFYSSKHQSDVERVVKCALLCIDQLHALDPNSASAFVEICVARVLSSSSSSPSSATASSTPLPYLSGIELRLLLKWLDSKQQYQNATFIRKHLAASTNLFWRPLFEALKLRVKILAALLRMKQEPKSVHLWTNAVLYLTLSLASDPTDNKYWILFTNYVFSVPLLVSFLDKNGSTLISRSTAADSCMHALDTDANFKAGFFDPINGELSIFVLGNLVELTKGELLGSSNASIAKLDVFVSSSTRLLMLCARYVKSKSTNASRFHPVLQWYSGPQLDIPNEFHVRLADILSFYWSRTFILAAFSSLLKFEFPAPVTSNTVKAKKTPAALFAKLGFKEPSALYPSAALDERVTIPLATSTLQSCQLYYNLTRTLLNNSTQIVTALCWTPHLIPRLWRLMNVLGPKNVGTQIFLKSAASPSKEHWMPILHLFCESCGLMFMTLDEDDIYERQYPFLLDELDSLSTFLNSFCFTAVWNTSDFGSAVDADAFDLSVWDVSQRLLGVLYDMAVRRPFNGDDKTIAGNSWIMKEMKRANVVDEAKNGNARVLAVLNSMPQCIPFGYRVDIFRHMVKADKATIGETPMLITIRRQSVFEDGIRQLGRITPSQLKQTIKVRFLNEFGLAEAGIDQNGVFKEFLEDMCKRAFASDFGMFRTTDDGNCVPSVSSRIHEDHLHLLEFVGRIFGKALYEGIVIDIPFATFVYAKMLGRMNFFEDLSSLDAQLTKNLIFLKHYAGDASDLGLTFTIDEDNFGAVVSKDIKPGGSGITVTNENKYEYIHLMSDYKLNQECKAQYKAFVGGFRTIMQSKFIRFFSPNELQVLMSGENVEINVADLRQHTRYEGGYFDQHPTIRLFWQVIEEMQGKERNAFLKFVTSCSNPPVGGFRHLDPPFTIRFFGMGKDATRLPTSSTCFNVLKLPSYQKKSSLKPKLMYAVMSGAGFELS
ncbi:Ubiquitin-protein ligase E3B [Chytriomyces hyalinus]|nr:Ubiquitin-protein ligase E3B [Chytriomyces hyalinus]